MLNNPLNSTDPEGEIIVPLLIGAAATAVFLAGAAFVLKPCIEGCQKIEQNDSSSIPELPDSFGNTSYPKDGSGPPEDDFDPLEPKKFKQSFGQCLLDCFGGVQMLAGAGDPFGTVGSMSGTAVGEAIGGGTIQASP